MDGWLPSLESLLRCLLVPAATASPPVSDWSSRWKQNPGFSWAHLASDLAADILVYFRRTIWPWIQKTNAQTESNRKRSRTQGMHMPVKSLRPSSHLFSLLLSVSSSASPSITPFSLSLFWNEHCCTGPHFSRIPAFEASREQSVTERARWSVCV